MIRRRGKRIEFIVQNPFSETFKITIDPFDARCPLGITDPKNLGAGWIYNSPQVIEAILRNFELTND